MAGAQPLRVCQSKNMEGGGQSLSLSISRQMSGPLAISPCFLSRKDVGCRGEGEVGVLGWVGVPGLAEKGQGLVWGEKRGHADG